MDVLPDRGDVLDWLESTLAALGDGVVFVSEDGTVLQLNSAAERLVGTCAADVIGRPVAQVLRFFNSHDGEPTPEFACFETGPDPATMKKATLIRAFGEHIPVGYRCSSVRDERGSIKGIVVTLQDRSANSVAWGALSETERLLVAVMKQSVVGVAVTELPDGRFVYSNDRFCQITGYSCEELLQITFKDVTHPDDEPEDLENLKRLKAGEIREFSREKRYICKDGSIAWVSLWASAVWAPGEPPGKVLVIARDITARKRAEEALSSRTHELQLMLDNMINAFIVWESVLDDEGRFVSFKFGYFNDAYAKIAGVGPEVQGKDVFEVWPTTERSWIEVYGEVAMTGNPKTFEMYHAPTKGWYHCNAFRPSDSPSQVCVIFEDVTERRKADQAVREDNERLEQRVKERTAELEMAVHELESFSYSVSHDLRGPLRAIDGFVHFIHEDVGPAMSAEVRSHCEAISQNARRMAGLIDDLLAFSRLSRAPITKSVVDVTAMVASIFAELAPTYGVERIEVQAADLGAAVCDPGLVRQVWENLIGNALKYSSKKSRAIVELSMERSDGELVYHVKDNGVGFEMEYAGRLFAPFQRLHGASEFEGSGVGLAIVQRIVHRHGGRVWAEGAVGQGATFSFTLPISDESGS